MRLGTMRRCWFAVGAILLGTAARSAHSQQASSPAAIQVRLQRIAGPYPVRAIEWFGPDSARVVVEDSTRTASAVLAQTWMFGPPVTADEAGGCPPQKVLGRRIARELWRQEGKRRRAEQIIVRVHGATGLDRESFVDMYYGVPDLDGPWVGDKVAR